MRNSLCSLGLKALVITAAITVSQPLFAEFKRPKISVTDPYLNSEILVSGKYHTLVPKGSILFLPERHKKRVANAPTGDYISLKKFISKNYAWLSTHEVTLEQARGTAPLPEQKMKTLQQSGRVIIAQYKKNPISVRSTKETQPK
ncbi:hypothetical protein [Rubritalea tangerina]|uniref:Uncharacterized protein n=1 Tax=Rubritalea tangerina TaxID=430798 RepID=A0ABW4ZDN3_9BACT